MVGIFNIDGIKPSHSFNNVTDVSKYILSLLLFIAILLIIFKLKLGWLLKIFVYAIQPVSLFIFFLILLDLLTSIQTIYCYAIAITLSLILTMLLWLYPEWYVIDVICLLDGIISVAILGISFSLIPLLFFMVVLMIEDAIAVHKIGYMNTLAEKSNELKLPMMFVVPYSWKYSFKKNKDDKFLMMGLGDAVIPSLLVISAYDYLHNNFVVCGVMVGTLVGYILLLSPIINTKSKAGLPFLNGGAILGLVVSSLAFGVKLF